MTPFAAALRYLRAISGGAAGSKSLELYSQRILQRDFDPGKAQLSRNFCLDVQREFWDLNLGVVSGPLTDLLGASRGGGGGDFDFH